MIENYKDNEVRSVNLKEKEKYQKINTKKNQKKNDLI